MQKKLYLKLSYAMKAIKYRTIIRLLKEMLKSKMHKIIKKKITYIGILPGGLSNINEYWYINSKMLLARIIENNKISVYFRLGWVK